MLWNPGTLDISINYLSCTDDDWYDFYFLVPHSLTLNLEICILTHLLYMVFLWMLLSLGMAISMMTHLLVSFSITIRSSLLHGMCLSVMTGESNRIVAS